MELARQGHSVSGLRRTGAVELQAAGITPVLADITRPESLARFAPGYDWVVHCVSSGGGSPDDYRRLYLEGMRNVLGWLGSHPPQKLVYTSSTGVYGQNNGELVDETSVTEPAADTARILLETEKLLLDADQVPAVVLRLAGIYGPGRGYWLNQFLNGEARLEGRGARFLNMIHRDDAVGVILAALQRGRPGETYNAVDDEPVPQLACFEWLSHTLRRALPPAVPVPEGPARRRGATNKQVSNRRLHQELDYRLKYPNFREGFAALLRSRESR